MADQPETTAAGTVPMCGYCGRPVRSSDMCHMNGSPTVYHIACTYAPQPAPSHGCICPPGSEATCQGMSCPRRGFRVAKIGGVATHGG